MDEAAVGSFEDVGGLQAYAPGCVQDGGTADERQWTFDESEGSEFLSDRRQREQEDRDQARRQAVDDYLRRLSPAERKAREAEVLAAADPEAREGYEQAPARYRTVLLLGLVREHVARELGRESIPAG